MNDHYIEKFGKKLRYGFTTGSCAAAASKAALIMLITGSDIHTACISTPGGINFNAEIIDIHREEDYVSCAVVKDGGDDPDVTTGSKVCAKVTLTDNKGIYIDGGEGVGRVTKPGLDQPIGNAAINSVPRKMIKENLENILIEYGIEDKGLLEPIIVSVLRKGDTPENTLYQIVSGHRRMQAIARIVERNAPNASDFAYIPCIVRGKQKNTEADEMSEYEDLRYEE